MPRKLEYLVVHCAATPPSQFVVAETIKGWHMNPPPKGRGWSRPGYTDVIERGGELVNLVSFDQDDIVDNEEMSWGVRGINSRSRHICMIGGVDEQKKPDANFTDPQYIALITYMKYTVLRHPDILIAGHNQFANKACPSFSIQDFAETVQIPLRNIYRGTWRPTHNA